MQIYNSEPDNPEGYALDLGDSFWSICVPEASINLITDPTFRAQTGVFQGDIHQHFTTRAAGAYTFSAYIKLDHDAIVSQVDIGLKDGTDALVGKRRATVNGKNHWTRISVTLNLAANTEYKAFIDNYGYHALETCWWQVEAKSYATTYFDGSTGVNFSSATKEYWWEGTPYASASQRSARTRTGGKLISLAEYGFRTLSITGLGGLPVEAQFDNTYGGKFVLRSMLELQREFLIGGIVYGDTWTQLTQRRQGLVALVTPTVLGKVEPVHIVADFGDNELHLYAYYLEGVEGELSGRHQQKYALRFKTESPYFLGISRTQGMTRPDNDLTFVCATRNNDGEWHNYIASETGDIYDLDHDVAGQIYACGTMPGLVHYLVDAEEIGVSEDTTVGAGLWASIITDIAVAKDGTQYIGAIGDIVEVEIPEGSEYSGDTTNAAYWNGSTWRTFGAGIDALVINAIEWFAGSFYIGGQIDHVVAENLDELDYYQCVRYDYSDDTWHRLGTGFGAVDSVHGIKVGPDGLIYITGNLTLVNPNGGYYFVKIAIYNPATDELAPFYPTYEKLSEDAPYPITPAYLDQITFDDHGKLYTMGIGIAQPVWGDVHNDGDDAQYSLLSPRGSQWEIDEVIGAPPTETYRLSIEGDEEGVYIGGHLHGFNADYWATTFPNHMLYKLWSRKAKPTPIDLLCQGGLNAIQTARTIIHRFQYQLYVASDSWGTGNPMYGKPSTIAYAGTAPTRARLLLDGELILYSLWNWTTRKQIVLSTPLNVQAGQTLLLYESNGSLFAYNLTSQQMLPQMIQLHAAASDLSALDIYPGDNVLTAMYTYPSTGLVSLDWQEAFTTL